MTTAVPSQPSSHDPHSVTLTLPVQVPCQNSDTPLDLYVEDTLIVLRQRGRNTVQLDPDDAECVAQALLGAAARVRAEQPEATVLTFGRPPG